MVESALPGAPATFLHSIGPREVDQHAPHQAGGQRKEVRTVGPLDMREVDEPQVELIDQRSRLQRVVLPLAGHRPAREPAELGVDDRNEALKRTVVALCPRQQESGYLP